MSWLRIWTGLAACCRLGRVIEICALPFAVP